jgi:hypothetical protein
MEQCRQNRSEFDRLGPVAAEVIPSALDPNPRNWWTRLELRPMVTAIRQMARMTALLGARRPNRHRSRQPSGGTPGYPY